MADAAKRLAKNKEVQAAAATAAGWVGKKTGEMALARRRDRRRALSLARQVGGKYSDDTIVANRERIVVWKNGKAIDCFPPLRARRAQARRARGAPGLQSEPAQRPTAAQGQAVNAWPRQPSKAAEQDCGGSLVWSAIDTAASLAPNRHRVRDPRTRRDAVRDVAWDTGESPASGVAGGGAGMAVAGYLAASAGVAAGGAAVTATAAGRTSGGRFRCGLRRRSGRQGGASAQVTGRPEQPEGDDLAYLRVIFVQERVGGSKPSRAAREPEMFGREGATHLGTTSWP